MANNYVITPDSEIYLLKCPLEMDSKHQISFANANAQQTYFQGLTKVLMDDATYMRKDGRLYFEGSFDTYLTYNYCMYKNKGYSTKWFYAFVTDIRFESNNSCSCQLKTDVFQTWMFDYTLKKSFIERSHVPKSGDTIGAYTVPENLETGEYKVYQHYVDNVSGIANSVILASTVDPFNSTDTSNIVRYSDQYDGLISGCGYYKFESNEINALTLRLDHLAEIGQSDAIVCLFMYPSAWAPYNDATVDKRVKPSSTPQTYDYGISRIATLDGYTPKNAKCLTYPYCYIMVSNGVGTANVYRQEVWSLDTNPNHNGTGGTYNTYNKMVITRWSVLCPGGSVRIAPINYNGSAINVDEGFTLGKYPELSWPVDLYTNWEVQNGTNVFGTTLTATESGLLGAGLQTLVGGLTGDVGNIAGGLRGVWNTMQEQYRHSLISPTVGGNINSGDVSAVSGLMAFQYCKMGVKSEFAQNIDNYFEMFGYKLNKVDTINTSSRSNWNYIKTIDVNMTGDIPERDLQELKDLYNSGFTIWHTTTYFMDYSQTNA